MIQLLTRPRIGILVVWVGCAVVFSGCATSRVHQSGKVGLLDRVLGGKSSQKRARGHEWQEALGEQRIESMDRRVAQWSPPLRKVQVTSEFGKRGGDYHDGIDLRARDGTPVFSVDDGIVAYAGAGIGGYGRMVVVRHAGGLSTVYAHNSKLLVSRGKRVKKGQRIALSGRTGRSRGAHLHFEVRSGITAVDPLALGQGPWWKKQLVEYRPDSNRKPAASRKPASAASKSGKRPQKSQTASRGVDVREDQDS